MKDLKWALIIGGIIFISYVIYNKPITPETPELKFSDSLDVQNSSEIILDTTINNKVYVVNGDTLDASKDKFIMILADKYRDKKISLSISVWYNYDKNICAKLPGVLKISIFDKKMNLLKSINKNINFTLKYSCQQDEDIDIYMGNLINNSYYLNATFTDINGDIFLQKKKKLDSFFDEKIDINFEEKKSIKNIKRKTRILLNELLSFKDNKDFHYYGFRDDYKYYVWLNKVNLLKEDPTNKLLLINDGFVVGELSTLGMSYMRSKGQETDYTKFTRDKIKLGLEN